jgi:hypothetical protein
MSAVLQRAGTERSPSAQVIESHSVRVASPFSARDVMMYYYAASGPGFEGIVVVGRSARDSTELFLLSLERDAFSQLAEASFAEDWESAADAIYDDL